MTSARTLVPVLLPATFLTLPFIAAIRLPSECPDATVPNILSLDTQHTLPCQR